MWQWRGGDSCPIFLQQNIDSGKHRVRVRIRTPTVDYYLTLNGSLVRIRLWNASFSNRSIDEGGYADIFIFDLSSPNHPKTQSWKESES